MNQDSVFLPAAGTDLLSEVSEDIKAKPWADNIIQIIDKYTWQERVKTLTRDFHGISGLNNFSHMNPLDSRPPSPLHIHKGVLEIHCIVKGKRLSIVYHDGEPHTYSPTGNEAMMVFPSEPHSNGDLPQNPCEYFGMQFVLSERDNFLGLSKEFGNDLCDRLQNMQNRLVRITPEILSTVRTAFYLLHSGDKYDRQKAVSYLVSFLYEITEMPPVSESVAETKDPHIQMSLDYIEDNINNPIFLEELAKAADYSLSRFKTKFREEMGVTPASYITLRKIEQAKLLLEQSDMSVTDLAYHMGWSTSNYFCSVFKKITGISPMQYRKSIHKESEEI